ncbi:hydrolase [Treponema sp. OMZ 838]|uniref:alpha/beta hydrolase n=1 Tax=Treponema TaxID=157 RepID=UPI000530128F|nr:alpha/beta hydrolase [Treponema sp. OMZ 838]AIW89974.1 hydrolase [Treponema sp. OMZ 838]
MKNAVVYIHGKGGSADEALYYKKFFNDDYELLGFNYESELPWQANEEFQNYFDSIIPNYNEILLIANSIGAYFSMLSLSEKPIKKALFVSPIVDMENIILHMMKRAKISEEKLRLKKIINIPFGEPLSWEYLSFVRKNPIAWNIPTGILYGKKDDMTSLETMTNFANKIHADLTVFDNGEHWFHTEEQMNFLDTWFRRFIQ